MIAFAKDLGADEGESKYDMLAVSMARRILSVRFSTPGAVPEIAVTQFGDGLARVVHGTRNVLLFHDWFERYSRYIDKTYSAAVFLGAFDHPEMERSVSLNSYPVETLPQRRMDQKYPLLVTGSSYELAGQWVIDRISELRPAAVRIACYSPMYRSSPYSDVRYRDLVESVGKLVSNVDVRPCAPICMLAEYMAASCTILHCGGRRGMVHSMAVSTGKCESYIGDDSFIPASPEQLLPFLS